ncbi:Alpha-latrocrustotoxin-Lt1a [Fusarium oxysporum f. sp. cubense race 1]|uniref:Alpha-latrocrustotoxin-Lt1a n=1 Tax=Fusarium oxysporum f. sp. cubense (strain race 1) TaxID=1229664 RepID=N4U4D4_FUSC1|nr:Alpha-latrocrustotoxin-Lt1a [Fusarium oxysporum f. sp. cubense race 1]
MMDFTASKAIYNIADLLIEEAFDENIFAKTQLALAQTNHHFYDIVNPRLRAASYCWAAREGRIDILKKAHENGANLSGTGTMRPEERATPLHYAIKQGHRDIVEYLAEIGVDPHVPARGVCDCWSDIEPVRPYALHMAIRHSGFEGAEKILVQKLGAYWTFQGTSALDHVDPHDVNDREIIDLLVKLPGSRHAADALRYALKWNELELVNRLLERSDMDASVPDFDGQTPLFGAIQCKRVDIVKLLLKRQEVNPGTPDRNGFTPLQVAVGVRSLPLVELLLQCEEVNARRTDAGKSSALHIDAARGELQIVNLLLEQNGLDVASPDSTGNTPLHWAVRSRDKKYHPSLVTTYDDDENNDDDEDEDDDSDTFDEPPGQEVNAGGHDQDGLTPLHHACLIADYEVVALLLQRQDVDPKARGITGQTPLHLAASNHQLSAKRIMDLLLEQPGVEITEVDHDGRTVLHYLCGGGEKEFPVLDLIETVLQAGVPLDQESATGLTAFHQAICSGYWSVALFLLDHGTDPMVSKRFKYNNSLLHIILKHSNRDDVKSELIERLIERGIEVDTYTDSPVFDPRFNEDDKIEKVIGIRSPDILVGTDCTPLLLAAMREYSLNNMKILLDAGADPSALVIIRDVEFEGKANGNRQAFLSGVFRHIWEPFSPGDSEILEHTEPIELLLDFRSRLDFDGPADSPLQEACKAAEKGHFALLKILLESSKARNVSESHVDKLIFAYKDKPEYSQICQMLESFKQKVLFID